MDDRIVPDVINDVLLPKGRYLENFNSSQFKCLQKFCHWVKKGGSCRMLMGFLTGDLDDRVIHYAIYDTILPKGRHPDWTLFGQRHS